MKQYDINMRLTFNATVTVEASNSKEAIEKAVDGSFVDDGLSNAEMIDWVRTSEPREVDA